MKIESWPIERPIPYARNARKIPQQAVDKVAASIKEFGFRQPIIVDKQGVIVAGHTRLLAAQKLGLSEVPVHVAAELTPAQIKAYRLADNRVADESSFDDALLALEIADLFFGRLTALSAGRQVRFGLSDNSSDLVLEQGLAPLAIRFLAKAEPSP